MLRVTNSNHDNNSQKPSTIRIVVIEPGKRPEARIVPDTLEEKQKIVGGRIEFFNIGAAHLLGVCNEEFLTGDLPRNVYVYSLGHFILGTIYITHRDEGRSLDDSTVNWLLSNPLWFQYFDADDAKVSAERLGDNDE